MMKWDLRLFIRNASDAYLLAYPLIIRLTLPCYSFQNVLFKPSHRLVLTCIVLYHISLQSPRLNEKGRQHIYAVDSRRYPWRKESFMVRTEKALYFVVPVLITNLHCLSAE